MHAHRSRVQVHTYRYSMYCGYAYGLDFWTWFGLLLLPERENALEILCGCAQTLSIYCKTGGKCYCDFRKLNHDCLYPIFFPFTSSSLHVCDSKSTMNCEHTPITGLINIAAFVICHLATTDESMMTITMIRTKMATPNNIPAMFHFLAR